MKDWMLKSLLVVVALLTPIHGMMLAAGSLIFADLVLGIWAAKKRGERITSAGLRRTVSKMFVYQFAIITAFICETWLLGGMLPVSNLVAAIIGLVELTSIMESLNTINGSPIFKSIIHKLGSQNDSSDNKQ